MRLLDQALCSQPFIGVLDPNKVHWFAYRLLCRQGKAAALHNLPKPRIPQDDQRKPFFRTEP